MKSIPPISPALGLSKSAYKSRQGRETCFGASLTKFTPLPTFGERCKSNPNSWRISMVKRVDKLTNEQRSKMDGWADKWIEIGLRHGNADREKFEAAVKKCYEFSGLPPPKRIVWVPSPMVMAIAAPVASYLIATKKGDAVGDA